MIIEPLATVQPLTSLELLLALPQHENELPRPVSMSAYHAFAQLPRRSFLHRLGTGLLALAGAPFTVLAGAHPRMSITCFIRYQIDPFQRAEFAKYADGWSKVIPRCGGDLIGYFLPREGTNDIAFALISFESLAAYESYRGRLLLDPEGKANFDFATSKRFIIREERTFLEGVPSTLRRGAASR